MNLTPYGLFPYMVGRKVRYFIKGVHGNFHIGSTDYTIDKMHEFFTAHGGLMKVLNFHQKSNNSDYFFSRYGCYEVLFEQEEKSHPFEQWGVDYYHPQFEFLRYKELKALLFFKKKEIFLFLDERITFNQQRWHSDVAADDIRNLVGDYGAQISAVLALDCLEGRPFHQINETIFNNKLALLSH